jgi:hypothetical protein
MDDATLARLEHENMHAWLRVAFSQVDGALIREESGVGLYGTGLPIALFNQVVVDDEADERDVAAAVEVMRGRGAPFYLVLRASRDARFRPLAATFGLREDDDTLPAMALHPIPSQLVTAAPGLEIRGIVDPAGLRDHAVTAARGFGIP